jgi:Family of unknown function (DUF6459)
MPTPPAPPPGDQPGAQPRGGRPPRRPCRKVGGPPLPDPAAVRLHNVPDSAPPYDDELAAAVPGARPRPAADQPPTGHRLPAAGKGQPALPGQFAQVLVETLAGTRPPRQLSSWTTERARSRIQRMGPLLTAGQRPQLRRVVARHPAADVIEMTVLLSVGPQVKALAVRLEHTAPRPASLGRPVRPGKWLCTQVEAA